MLKAFNFDGFFRQFFNFFIYAFIQIEEFKSNKMFEGFNKHLISPFAFWPIYKFHLVKYFWFYFQFQFLVYCIVSCKDENKIKPNRFLWTSAWNKMAGQVRSTICCSVQNPLTNVVNIDKVFFSVDNGVMYGECITNLVNVFIRLRSRFWFRATKSF